jgi:PAS domain S-box-containing protein
MAEKKAADELLRLNQQLEDLARFPQENPNPVMRVKKDGTILFANAACSSLRSFECEQGRVLPGQYQELAAKVLETGKSQVIEADGDDHIFTLNFVPVKRAAYVNVYGNDITEHKKAEEQIQKLMTSIQQERDKLSALLNSIPDEVWFADTQGNFVLANPAALQEFALSPTENMSVEDLAGSLEVYHPDGSPRPVKEAPPLCALKGETIENQEEIIRIPTDGELRYRQVSAAPVKDPDGNIIGSVSVARDITELKRVEESLREARDYLDNLINCANAPIIVWNTESKITRFNHAFEQLTGRSSDEMIGKMVDILIPADRRRDALEKIHRASIKGERWEVVEIPIQHVDGSVRTVLWNSATIFATDSNTPVATIAQGVDITEQKREMDLKDEFIGMVSHELRTPLTVIIGALSTATDARASKEDKEELIQEAASSAESLAGILDNMLELSRYQAGRLQLDKKSVSISDIAEKAVQKARRKYDTHKIVLDISDKIPEVDVDAVRIEQVLYNLVENAVKYSPTGSEVRIFSRRKKDALIICVSDRGEGIASEDQPKLFEPFARLKENATSGIGLGLVVCKRLVEAHDGRIWIESQLGEGSTFLFTIPLDKKWDKKEIKTG